MTDAALGNRPAKQPPGLYLLFGVEMWERFSYYGMRAILILFLVDKSMGGWGLSKADASDIYKWYTSLAYMTPLLGGYLADRVLGTHRSLIIGGVLITAGHICLAFPSREMFFAGLGLVILGTGFFKSNVSTMVGQLYQQGDPRRDGGFTIFYMGINLGALLGQIVCGLGEKPAFGWHFGFGSAAVGMFIGLVMYVTLKRRYLGAIGDVPQAREAAALSKSDRPPPLTREEKHRILALFVLIAFDISFWLAFEQAGSSMNLFAFEKTDRFIGSFEIPASWLQSVNPLAILIFGGLFARFWVWLARSGREPGWPVKFAGALFLLGVGFLFLVLGARTSDAGEKAALLWLVFAYVFHTWGELALSPVGLSMVTKLAPLQFASLLMGTYWLGHFISHFIAGTLAGLVEMFEKGQVYRFLGGQADFFLLFVGTSWISAIVCLLLAKPIMRLMHGRR
jgi:POT family proton-dependent oligopeptide transporter